MKESENVQVLKEEFVIRDELKKEGLNIGRYFGALSPWILFTYIILGSLLVIGLGFWTGHLLFRSSNEATVDSIDAVVGAILGLLGFILGFTFSLTWSRFGSRNSLVVLQAKLLGTCYLRTSLLPQKLQPSLRKLFREYVGVLLELQTAGHVDESVMKINDLHIDIWNQTTLLVREDMDSELRSLFTSAVNELINITEERKIVGLVYSIPEPIWRILLLLIGMGMFAFGYQIGVSGVNRIAQVLLLPIPFGLLIVLISDLNSTRIHPRLKVTKKPLEDVLEMMGKEIA
ncbi:hypothetical protein [Pollutibacter soli]|uniref:bestrophin-like domain n=1 Tax=Pollutibacter soli TaxID=3034157 RepID=UPI0030141CD0